MLTVAKRKWLSALCCALGLGAIIAGPARGQSNSNPAAGMGTLGGLMMPKEGRPKHEGSWDRSGGNGDLRPVEPGQTLTMMDYKGAGIVRRFWVTIAPRADKEIHRQLILRMYWDDEKVPSVEAPIGDFFGVGFGEQKDFISLPLNETSGGYNCYWPMPFHKSARWTVTNMSKKRVDAFYYNMDFTAYDKLPKELMHFHAQWRRENPTKPGVNYTILDAKGRGTFVGTALYMQNRKGRGIGFLEGDEMIYVDGEDKPSIIGTGTEDYFSSGWYYDRGEYSAPYHGINLKDTTLGRISTYRWHIEDAMPFKKSLKVTIEHGTNNDHVADYSSVAYYYLTGENQAFTAIPKSGEDLLPFVAPPPFRIPGSVEGESLIAGAKASDGNIETQDMSPFEGEWSAGGQLWWLPHAEGATLSLSLPATDDGDYELTGYFTKAKDYGIVQVIQDGKNIGSPINFYGSGVTPTGAVRIGKVSLKRGGNPITFKIVGKDASGEGYLVGIDALVLRKR